jgi:hypothetical protein
MKKTCGYEGCKREPMTDSYGGELARCKQHKGKHAKRRRPKRGKRKAKR